VFILGEKKMPTGTVGKIKTKDEIVTTTAAKMPLNIHFLVSSIRGVASSNGLALALLRRAPLRDSSHPDPSQKGDRSFRLSLSASQRLDWVPADAQSHNAYVGNAQYVQY
jgi:hypothetical protein